MRAFWLAFLAVGVVASVGGTVQGRAAGIRSGIRGVAVAGPVAPVERPGEPNTRPLPGALITVQPDLGGPEVARARADPRGRFRIQLPPGHYLLVPLAPDPGRQLPHGEPQLVDVRARRFTTLVARYDSGIR